MNAQPENFQFVKLKRADQQLCIVCDERTSDPDCARAGHHECLTCFRAENKQLDPEEAAQREEDVKTAQVNFAVAKGLKRNRDNADAFERHQKTLEEAYTAKRNRFVKTIVRPSRSCLTDESDKLAITWKEREPMHNDNDHVEKCIRDSVMERDEFGQQTQKAFYDNLVAMFNRSKFSPTDMHILMATALKFGVQFSTSQCVEAHRRLKPLMQAFSNELKADKANANNNNNTASAKIAGSKQMTQLGDKFRAQNISSGATNSTA